MSKSVKIITNKEEFITVRRIILDAYARAKMCGEVSKELETLRNIYDITFYSLADDEAKEGLQLREDLDQEYRMVVVSEE